MRILILTNHSYMFWQFRRELVQELLKEHTVYLCMPFVGHEEDFKKLGAKCIEISLERRGTNPLKEIRLYRTYKAVIRRIRPDIVVTYSIKPNIYGGLVCQKEHIPYYTNVQGLGTAFQSKRMAEVATVLYRMGLKKAEKIFFENTENAKEFIKRRIAGPERVIVLNGAGVNLEYFTYEDYPQNEKFHFLYLGRIMREKGMDELFEALQKLRGDFILDLVGFYEEEYVQTVRELEAEGLVKFHGFQEDPRPFYAAADCVVMPSYHEGMSNVNLEASAVGRPVITTDISGCREAVDDGITGILCKSRNPDDLTRAMQSMLNMPREKRCHIGVMARKKMEREFDRIGIVKKTIREVSGRFKEGKE